MMEEFRMSEDQKILKMYKVRWLDSTFSTIGHVYSVIVEELDIEGPDLNDFIKRLNEYIKIGGNGFACVEGPMDSFTWKRFYPLQTFLLRELSNITTDSFNKIVKAAYPAFVPISNFRIPKKDSDTVEE